MSIDPDAPRDDGLRGFNVVDGELVAVTAEGATPIAELLARMQRAFDMDVVFVSQFVAGERLIRHVAARQLEDEAMLVGASDPLEESYCHLVVTGRLPQAIADTSRYPVAMALRGTHACRVGSHLAVPIVTDAGAVYGTVCCFSHAPIPEVDAREKLELLRTVASLLGSALSTTPAGRGWRSP